MCGRALRAIGQGWHLQEGKVTIGRASNASGSCSPGRSACGSRGLLLPRGVRVSGQARASRGGQSREGRSLLVPLFPCLDESSFLRERKVSCGRGRRPRPSPWACRALICSCGSHFCCCGGGGRPCSGTRARAGPPCCARSSCLVVLAPPALGLRVCACVYVLVCARARVWVNMCMRTGVHTCVVCVHAFVCVGMHVCLLCACVCVCLPVYMCVSVHTRVYIRVHMPTVTCALDWSPEGRADPSLLCPQCPAQAGHSVEHSVELGRPPGASLASLLMPQMQRALFP